MRLHSILSLLAVPAARAACLPGTSASCAEPRNNQGIVDMSKLQYVPSNQKPRVFVMSDVLNEPDDSQSFVRYLLYSNEFETRGLCAITSTWMRNQTHPDAIRRVVKAYGQVVDNLNKHVHPLNQYTSVDRMLSLITTGPAAYGQAALSMEPSEGALLLIKRLRESTEPLWVLMWGGSNTLAQALKHMRDTMTEGEAAVLRSRIRVYSISDQDDTGELIRSTYPDIFYIASIHAFSFYSSSTWIGMVTGLEDNSINKMEAEWVSQNIQYGPLGSEYPDRVYGLEGDTPSFLYLIQNGLGDRENPTYGSWGGRYSYTNIGGKHYSDAADSFYGPGSKSRNSNHVTLARWRDHFQNDMATRMQWTVSPDFGNGTHPPVPVVNGTKGPAPLRFPVTPGSQVVLDASATFDPDHPADASNLEFEWYQYRESDFLADKMPSDDFVLNLTGLGRGASSPDRKEANDAGFRGYVTGDRVQVTVPQQDEAYEYHLILQVTSRNSPDLPVRRYLRILMLASNDEESHYECCDVMNAPPAKTTNWDKRSLL